MTQRAFIAGIEEYPRMTENAVGARASAASVVRLLSEQCGFTDGDIRCPAEEDLSRDGILAGLQWLAAGLTAGDRVCFYFMGHGALGVSDGYLLAYDYDGLQGSRADAVSASDFRRSLTIPERVEAIVVLDACSSGAFPPTHDRGRKGGAPRGDERGFPVGRVLSRFVEKLKDANVVVLASCRADEYSNADILPGNAFPTGVFTELLVRQVRATPGKTLAQIASAVCDRVCGYVAGSPSAACQHPLTGGVKAIHDREWMRPFAAGDPFDPGYVVQSCASQNDRSDCKQM